MISDFSLKEKWMDVYESNLLSSSLFNNKLEKIFIKQFGDFFAIFNAEFVQKKRPAVFQKETENQVIKPYNPQVFNFTKIDISELLFYYDSENNNLIEKKMMIDDLKYHFLIINKSPIEKFHALFIPFPFDEFSQKINSDIVHITIQFFSLFDSPDLKIGFNSVGGYASINHCHLQLIFLREIDEKLINFPIEDAESEIIFKLPVNEDEVIIVKQLKNYLVNGFIINVSKINEIILNQICFMTGIIINIFIKNKIAHNLLFTNKGKSIFIIPRKHQNFNIYPDDISCAWLEIGGIAICKNQEFYEKLNEQQYNTIMTETVNFEKKEFDRIKLKILEKFQRQLNY